MNVSVIDIGSNTVKATIFCVGEGKCRATLDYRGYKAKLISDVCERDGRRFLSNDGIDKLLDALYKLVEFSSSNSCELIFAFATASLRGVDNINEILNCVKSKLGLEIEVLSGDDEALCSLRGLLNDEMTVGINEGVMVDMGGGSTEIVYFSNGSAPKLKSLPFGCVSLYERFVKGDIPTEEESKAIEAYVYRELLSCEYARNLNCPMFLIGGSGRAVGKITKSEGGTHKLKADGSVFTSVLKKFSVKGYIESVENLIPGRTLTVCPAAVAYRKIASFVSPSSISISESGVREGYLEKILP